MKPEVLNKIKNCIKTAHVDLANMKINDDEIMEIMQKIKLLQPNITVVDLDRNKLGDKGSLNFNRMFK